MVRNVIQEEMIWQRAGRMTTIILVVPEVVVVMMVGQLSEGLSHQMNNHRRYFPLPPSHFLT